MALADENKRIMESLEELEAEIGTPDFWSTPLASQIVAAHASVLQAAIQRGLTTFGRRA